MDDTRRTGAYLFQVRILGIVGSLRAGSLTRATAHAAEGLVGEGVTFEIFDRLGDLPHFNADIPLTEEPAPVVLLKTAIAAADGILILTPEYNYSIPGVLKNAIDWVSRPPASSVLRRKPAGIAGVSGGMSGSIRAQAHLRQMLQYSETYVMPQPEFLLARSHEHFDKAGVLTNDGTREVLRAFMASLAEWIARTKT